MNDLLAFSGVGFGYGERAVLSGLTAGVPQAARIALVGPNGAGKTTLFRLAAGTLRPDAGSIRLNGQPLASLNRRRIARSIALVPQNVEMPFPFTVEQFVEQGRTPYLGMFGALNAEDRDAIERAFYLTDTAHLRARIFNQLSGGERQRVKVALGLAQNPRLLLLDEPTQHLDIGRQLETIALIRKLSDEGIAIVASMHDLGLVEGTFSRVWLLAPNEPLREGEPGEMLRPQVLEQVFNYPPHLADFACLPVFARKETIPS